jgi:hypothetical protein
MNKQLALDIEDELESGPAWNDLSMAAKRHRIDDYKAQVKAEFAQHLLDESDVIFVKMDLLNHIADHIRRLGNLLHVNSELPE